MATDIQTSLDSIKRQALYVILQNVENPFPSIKSNLYDYIRTGGSSFSSLLQTVYKRDKRFSSSYFNANLMLGYLDFYALYTIVYANYDTFAALSDVASSKYAYAYSLYTEANAMLKEKRLAQDYPYTKYLTNMFIKNADMTLSKTISRSGKYIDVLNMSPVITLPYTEVYEYKPIAIKVFTSDTVEHDVETSTDKDALSVMIKRSYGNKVGIVKGDPLENIQHISGESFGYNKCPEFSGAIAGHNTEYIIISIDSITDGVVKIKCSSDGLSWSKPYEIKLDEFNDIVIEDEINTGLKTMLESGKGLAATDIFKVTITNESASAPSMDALVEMDAMNPISFVKYDDISAYKVDVEGNAILKRSRFNNSYEECPVYDARLSHYIPINGIVDSFKISLSQPDYDIHAENGSLHLAHSFDIANITAYACEYKSSGAVTWNPIDVEEVNTVHIESTEYRPSIEHSLASPDPEKNFIEYNVVATYSAGRAIIPTLPATSNTTIFEYLIPSNIMQSSATDDTATASCQTRFNIDLEADLGDGNAFIVYDIEAKQQVTAFYSSETRMITIAGYNWKRAYVIWYKIKTYSMLQISTSTSVWNHTKSGISYAYYIDEAESVNLAIRSNLRSDGILEPFTGSIASSIEMRSATNSYISPIVFNYSLAAI